LNFTEEVSLGVSLNFQYTLLVKRTFLNVFSNVEFFGKKLSKKTAKEIEYCINVKKLQNPLYNYFVKQPKKHSLIKCYKVALTCAE
jgi:hypothetical protein